MPIVTMHDIEVAEELLYRIETIGEGITHSIHLSQYISRAIHIRSLVMHAIDLIVGLIVASASKNVNFVAPSGQRFGDL